MIRLSKLADYAIVILCHAAKTPQECIDTARGLADITRLPLPTVSKVLKMLLKAGLLTSQRGINGGYQLARAQHEISVVDIIEAVDGPIALTECSMHDSTCGLEKVCPAQHAWKKINTTVIGALQALSLADMHAHPIQTTSKSRKHLHVV